MRGFLKGSAIATAIAASVVIFSMVVASMFIFGWGFFSRATADFRGQTQAIERTRANADFRIQAYDRFFALCSAIQTDESRIAALNVELATDPPPDRVVQINASLTAVVTSRAGKIVRYNADATRDFTVGQFRDSDLPYRISLEGNTQCAAS